jgi:hypothetical protein
VAVVKDVSRHVASLRIQATANIGGTP